MQRAVKLAAIDTSLPCAVVLTTCSLYKIFVKSGISPTVLAAAGGQRLAEGGWVCCSDARFSWHACVGHQLIYIYAALLCFQATYLPKAIHPVHTKEVGWLHSFWRLLSVG